MSRATLLAAALMVTTAAVLPAQNRRASRPFNDDDCRGQRARFCEVREDNLGARASVSVDATPNGGISVRATDRSDILLHTRITVWSDTADRARTLASQVRVLTDGGRVRAEGPASQNDNQYWTASFELEVPRQIGLQLTARNGGINVDGVDGEVRFETRNGGVTLSNVDGDVQGTTVNGGITVRLGGTQWNGTGLEVGTRNGGISMSLPDAFNAQLDVETVNGGVRSDFGLPAQDRRNRHLVTTLGAGGPRLRLSTVNGGIRLNRR